MAFYFIQEPAIPFNFCQSAFNQPRRSQGLIQWLNLLMDQENAKMDQENNKKCQNCDCNKTESEKTQMEPVKVAKKNSKSISVNEDLMRTEIKIELEGYDITAENVDVQVMNDEIIQIKIDAEELKFDRKFKIPSRSQIDEIECKIDAKEEGKQNILITIPKNNQIKNIPTVYLRK